jgi:hypothetical protein
LLNLVAYFQTSHLAQGIHRFPFDDGLTDFFKQASPLLTTAGG